MSLVVTLHSMQMTPCRGTEWKDKAKKKKK